MSRILVVEDEQHLADGLRFNLEAEQYDVDLADNGEDALRLLTADPARYDLVILDVMLPGIDGFSVATELRTNRRFVPILMLTARGRSEDVLRGFGAGADDYLPKPFELPILLSRVRGLLRRHEWFRAEAAAPVASPPVASQFSSSDRSIDFRARRFWRRFGVYTRTPTPARSTTSSSASAATSRRSRPTRGICRPCAASATASWRTRSSPAP
jgi:DNA-binding response OmpR family regulator